MLFSQSFAFLCFAAFASSRTVLPKRLNARQDPSPTGLPPPKPTICGDIIDAVNDPDGFQIFWASDAFDCLRSVPFNPAVASRFVKYWNETIQFQSTLAYLKNPPAGYQQPAVDVLDELSKIQQRIDSGFYKNQYAFEADFQLLAYALNDGHVALTAGALAAFSFASPVEVASVSVDGKEPPKVFITDDIIYSRQQGWEASPIKTINGEDAVEFLTKYAALNSYGYVEPHAEWNAMMSNPALDVQGGLSTFSGSGTFYPGENLTFTFENGTDPLETIWVAIYNELANFTGPLTTGGDFYNFFVLGQAPASFDPTKIVPPSFSDVGEAPNNLSEASYGAYPEDPDIAQYDLGILHGGFVTGYLYKDISTGVLSLPTFDAPADTIKNYSQSVVDFYKSASEANVDRIIIDLQHNAGGAILIPFTIFKLFFPDLLPFAGSRRRVFAEANTLGSTFTNFWESLNESDPEELTFKQEISASEWVITNRLKAGTGENFTSWSEYAGPINDNGDTLSLTEQYDLANIVFDRAAFDELFPRMYLPNKTEWVVTERRWNPDQIVLLTDGLCSSACSLFVEMMTREGVRTVVAGGRPSTGPMQAASGNRGAMVYDSDSLDDDILSARALDQFVDADVNASLPEVRDPGMYLRYASFNLRDQVRENEKVPLQFKYEAADCRIYYTLANLYNFTRLWHDVSAAAWDDPSLCVQDSTGYSTTNNANPKTPPPVQIERPTIPQDEPTVDQVEFEEDPTGGLRDGLTPPLGGNSFELCLKGGSCRNPQAQCRLISVDCQGEGFKSVNVCLPPCTNRGGSSTCPGLCTILQTQESKVRSQSTRKVIFEEDLHSGLCFPRVGNKKLGCASNPKLI